MSLEPIVVGVLFSRTGLTAVTEQSMLDATLFSIGEVNEAGGINGRELVPICLDPGGDPALYNEMADRLLAEKGVRVIFGCYMSSSRKAVIRAVERRNGLLCYPAQYEGFEYSNNVIYCGAVPNQNSLQLGSFLLQNVGTRFYMVGSDYIWPQESNRIMSDLILRNGGTVAGQRTLSLEAERREYASLVRDIRKASPDVIFCNFVGESIVHFYQAYADAGLSPATMPIASLTTSEADIRAMGAEVGSGHLTSATYFQSCPGERNEACMKRYAERTGGAVTTNMCWEAAYFQVQVVADAMRCVDSDEIDVLRPAILDSTYDAPQGPIRLDRRTGHTALWPKIGRATPDGQFEIIAMSESPVDPDPYLANQAEHEWVSGIQRKYLVNC